MIDRTAPRYDWGVGWHSKSISDKQASYLLLLAAQKGVRVKLERLNRGDASALIDDLRRFYSLTHGHFRRTWVDTGIVIPVAEMLRQEFRFWMRIDGVTEPDGFDAMTVDELGDYARSHGLTAIYEQLRAS